MLLSIERREVRDAITFKATRMDADKRSAISFVANGGHVIEAESVCDIELALAEMFGDRVYYVHVNSSMVESGVSDLLSGFKHHYFQFVTQKTLLDVLKVEAKDLHETLNIDRHPDFDLRNTRIPFGDHEYIQINYRVRTPQAELDKLRKQLAEEEERKKKDEELALNTFHNLITKGIEKYKNRKPTASTVSKCVTLALSARNALFGMRVAASDIALLLYADAVFFRENPNSLSKKRTADAQALVRNYMSDENKRRDPFIHQTWVELNKT